MEITPLCKKYMAKGSKNSFSFDSLSGAQGAQVAEAPSQTSTHGLDNPVVAGLQVFADSVNQLAQTRALSSARDQVDQIRQSDAADEEKLTALRTLGQHFALNAMGMGMPVAKIGAALGQIVPQEKFYQTPEQAVLNAPDGSGAADKGQTLIDARYGQQSDLAQSKNAAAAERAQAAATAARAKFNETKIAEFRNTITKSKNYTNYVSAANAAQNLSEFLKNPSATTDISTIFEFMKALDPTSVVREGEQALFKNARGLYDKLSTTMESARSGKVLSPAQRVQALDTLKTLQATYRASYKKGIRPVTRQAARIGLPIDEIDPELDLSSGASNDGGGSNAPPATAPATTPSVDGAPAATGLRQYLR
jgi:hypothetical protein